MSLPSLQPPRASSSAAVASSATAYDNISVKHKEKDYASFEYKVAESGKRAIPLRMNKDIDGMYDARRYKVPDM